MITRGEIKPEEKISERAEQIRQELKEASKPLVDFLYKHGNPHFIVMVTQADSELLVGELSCFNDLRD